MRRRQMIPDPTPSVQPLPECLAHKEEALRRMREAREEGFGAEPPSVFKRILSALFRSGRSSRRRASER